MKKIATIIVLVFAFTINAQAQKKGGKNTADKMLKKLTTELSLSEAQQNEIKPLLVAQIADRKAMNEQRKALKDADKKPSKEERKQMRADRSAKETAMNSKMASILSKEQLVKYEAFTEKNKGKGKKKGKKKKQ